MPETNTNELGGWIVGIRFARWRDNRRAAERKWRANLAAYRIRPDLDLKATSVDGEREANDPGYPLTRQKVQTAHAALKDVILPANKVAFMLVPEKAEDAQLLQQSLAGTLEEPPPPAPEMDLGMEEGGLEPGMEQEMFPQPTLADRARAIQADVAAAEDLIVEQLENCEGPEEISQAIFMGCLYGRSWMKRAVGLRQREQFAEVAPGVYLPDIREEAAPTIDAVDTWSVYWDMEAPRPEDGEGIIYRTHLSPHDLRQYIGEDGYDREAILRVLRETAAAGQGTDGEDSPRRRAVQESSRSIETFEFWGLAPQRLVEAHEARVAGGEDVQQGPADETEDEQSGRMAECHAIVCSVPGETGGPSVVRFKRTRRQDVPFYGFDLIWEPDDLVGSGIADTVTNEQRILNDLTVAILTNAGEAARLIIGVKRAMGEGDLSIERKRDAIVVELKNAATMDVNEVLSQFQVRTALRELLEVFNHFLSTADLSSGIPRAEQGNQEPTPQTLGELRERLNRAGKLLGGMLLQIDRMTERVLSAFYRWNLLNPEVKRGQGIYRVKALGYSGFMSRYEKVEAMRRLLEMALTHPKLERETNIRKAWSDVIRANDIDPDEFLLSPEQAAAAADAEAEAEAAAAGPGPEAPAPEPSPQEIAAMETDQAARDAEVQRTQADAEYKAASAEEKRTSTLIKRTEAAAAASQGPVPMSPDRAARGGVLAMRP